MCVHSMREEAERLGRLAAESADPNQSAELNAKARLMQERAAQMEAAKHSLGFIEQR